MTDPELPGAAAASRPDAVGGPAALCEGALVPFSRVSTATQLSSQVLPPSSEKACSKRMESAVIGVMMNRTTVARPLRNSCP